VEPEAILGVSRPFSVTTPKAFNKQTLNHNQFINLVMTFLGESPLSAAVESLVRFIRTGYVETEEERKTRLEKSCKEADSMKRRMMLEQLFDIWDCDGSGYIEINEIEMVLSKWRENGVTNDYMLKEAC